VSPVTRGVRAVDHVLDQLAGEDEAGQLDVLAEDDLGDDLGRVPRMNATISSCGTPYGFSNIEPVWT
jgi:hypothetical protein